MFPDTTKSVPFVGVVSSAIGVVSFGFAGASQYGQPMMGGYQPGTQGYQYNPQQQAQPAAAPAADPAAGTTTTTQNTQA